MARSAPDRSVTEKAEPWQGEYGRHRRQCLQPETRLTRARDFQDCLPWLPSRCDVCACAGDSDRGPDSIPNQRPLGPDYAHFPIGSNDSKCNVVRRPFDRGFPQGLPHLGPVFRVHKMDPVGHGDGCLITSKDARHFVRCGEDIRLQIQGPVSRTGPTLSRIEIGSAPAQGLDGGRLRLWLFPGLTVYRLSPHL